MNKLTDRIANQNIINLAVQQYENQKKSKLPSIIVPLSSEGKVYAVDHPLRSGKIEMRYMTAYDEDILTNVSYIKNGVVFDKLLESIILTPVSVNEISAIDKFGLIINARILAYGAEYPVTVTDPITGTTLSRVIDLNTIQPKPFTLTPDDLGEFSYAIKSSNTKIHFRYPASEQDDLTISGYLKTIITQVEESRDAADIENFIKFEFLAKDAKEFRNYVTDNAPGLDLNIEFEGENGSTFISGFPIGPELFWF
jgi:hypothetical protein